MSLYVDGYVIPVPKKKLTAYRRLARTFGKLWIEQPRGPDTCRLGSAQAASTGTADAHGAAAEAQAA